MVSGQRLWRGAITGCVGALGLSGPSGPLGPVGPLGPCGPRNSRMSAVSARIFVCASTGLSPRTMTYPNISTRTITATLKFVSATWATAIASTLLELITVFLEQIWRRAFITRVRYPTAVSVGCAMTSASDS